jgi:hypothetical protein
VGTTVLDHFRACVKVVDYCDPSSADTLTWVKSLVMMFDNIVPPFLNVSQ